MRKNHIPTGQETPSVAVVIAARNEAENLPALLDDLARQTYPQSNLEIWVADDRSTDDTWQIITSFMRKMPNLQGIRIREANPAMTGKKNALTQCIRKARAPLILQTDADCRVGSAWVRSMAQAFTPETGIVVGYSGRLSAPGFLATYDALDYLALNAANYGMLLNGKPWSGSGTNLAFQRAAFTDIRGYEPVAQKIGDDDMYLVQQIPRLPQYQARVNVSPDAWVRSGTDTTLSGFLNQRIRWASNARGLEKVDKLFWFFLLSAFISNLALLVGGVLFLPMVLTWALAKFVAELIVTTLAAVRFQESRLLPLFPVWFILQPIYIPYVTVMGLLGRFKWKV
ncbi:MAG: glycosyltransferase [Lentisphaeria bacterium]|nr:glycosyltransferase [Candidatus Neomarinimicrobiota bacterium]MCF7842281.1 glycosyltransferase [Lentisphaeria bacterium]